MTISERIKELCKQRGITINQLEKATGIGRGSVGRWDTHSPSIDKITPVAAFFEVTTDYLILGEIAKPTPVSESGLSTDKRQELIDLFAAAPPALQEAALTVLRAAEGQSKAQDADQEE